jgi:hypothetical protein
MQARLAALLGLALALSSMGGCVTPLMPDCIRFGRSGQFCPLPPAALPAVDAGHLVDVTREGHTDSFMGQLHTDAQALRLAGSSLFGTGLFLMQYDGKQLTVQPDMPQLPADKLLVMLELALADPAVLGPRLHDLELKVTRDGGKEVRELSEHGHLIAHIEQDAAPLARRSMTITVPPLGLTVQMKPLETGSP